MSRLPGRFEFRVWGSHLRAYQDRLTAIAAPSEPSTRKAETYVLSRTTDAANVKIRDGLLDIKLMIEQVGPLERWRPVLKVPFPLDSRVIVEQLFPSLGVAPPNIAQPSYTDAQFVRDLARSHRDLLVAEIMKVRRRFEFEDCTAEFAEVGIEGGAKSETIEVESDDPASVLRAIAKLGLNSQTNISYVRHLKIMTGMTSRATA